MTDRRENLSGEVKTVYRLADGRELERLDDHTFRIKECGTIVRRVYGSIEQPN